MGISWKQAVGGRLPRYAPDPPPAVGAEALCAAEQTATLQQFHTANTFSHPPLQLPNTRQHGGEQSGLVTLTFDLLILKVVSESRVMWATSVPILVFLGLSCSRVRPNVRDRQTSDKGIA